MNKFFIYIIITFTAFTSVQAQHPRVCDYVSLKHALKGREFEVITARPTDKAIELLHTKEEIRIPTIGEFGKEIDSLDIIDYNGDTVYIYRRSIFEDVIKLRALRSENHPRSSRWVLISGRQKEI